MNLFLTSVIEGFGRKLGEHIYRFATRSLTGKRRAEREGDDWSSSDEDEDGDEDGDDGEVDDGEVDDGDDGDGGDINS
jgi:hypothetical protein